MNKGLRIVQFTAQNVKRLKLVTITPKGHLVPITGANGQGKTSVLDAIWWALGGADNITSVPIHKGAETGTITLDLGDFVVERVFTSKKKCTPCRGKGRVLLSETSGNPADKECEVCQGYGFIAENGTEVTVRAPSAVEGKKGPKYDSPQAMLDALVGSLSFDPLEFARASAPEQFDLLRKAVALDFDFAGMVKANDADYKERTRINKAAKEQRAIAAGITVKEGLPEKHVDEAALLAELDDAYKTNSARERAREARAMELDKTERDKKSLVAKRSRIDQLRTELERLESELKAEEYAIGSRLETLAKLPTVEDAIDVTAIRAKLDEAKATNLAIDRRQERARAISDAEAHEGEAKKITERMEGRETAKLDAIRAAKMPVDGLGLGEGFVTFNGLPFEQASDAERLRVSVGIAMATNPKLRVIRIRDGSLLDEKSMALIADMAKSGDYQFWLERVDTSGKVGIVLEDGAVVADNQVAEA